MRDKEQSTSCRLAFFLDHLECILEPSYACIPYCACCPAHYQKKHKAELCAED